MMKGGGRRGVMREGGRVRSGKWGGRERVKWKGNTLGVAEGSRRVSFNQIASGWRRPA